MMNVISSAATHWCRVGGTFVFLDLSRDRYFMLEQSAADRFCRIVRGAQEEGDADWLAARGLHHLAPPIDRPFSEEIAPTSSLLEEPDLERGSAVETARAVFALAIAQRHVRKLALIEILPNLSQGVPVPPHVQRSDARQVAAAFKRARHYLSGMDECLSRGVAMRRVLAGKGCEARLVIGVTLPFAAHCWVQLGSAVLTDPLDVVTPYTPILVA
jgi:hypothetical protein